MTGSNIWDSVLTRVETKVNRHSFYTWFKPTTFVSDRDGMIVVRVPNALFRDWLTKHYAAVIEEALAEVQRTGAPITYVTDDAANATAADENAVAFPPDFVQLPQEFFIVIDVTELTVASWCVILESPVWR